MTLILTCCKCKRTLSLEAFHRDRTSSTGRKSKCRECTSIAKPPRPAHPDLAARFENYEVDEKTECWNWLGYMDRNGYGRVYDPLHPRGQRTEWAHRAFYRRHRGPIPERHQLDHTCENTQCVNPEHLDVVTAVEHARRTMERLGKNQRHLAAARLRSGGLTYGEIAEVLKYNSDSGAHIAVKTAVAKGLINADEVPPPRRLTAAEREDVRDLYTLGVPQTELAAWYGVDGSHISRVCTGLDTRLARRARGQAA